MQERTKEIADVWLAKAQEDILWARDSFEDGHYSGVCFLSQQAAGKALKAYLFSQREKLVRTHNLLRLLKRCTKHNMVFEKVAPSANSQ